MEGTGCIFGEIFFLREDRIYRSISTDRWMWIIMHFQFSILCLAVILWCLYCHYWWLMIIYDAAVVFTVVCCFYFWKSTQEPLTPRRMCLVLKAIQLFGRNQFQRLEFQSWAPSVFFNLFNNKKRFVCIFAKLITYFFTSPVRKAHSQSN